MRAPRSSRALVSPSAQRMASTRLLLPLPLGPTTAVTPGSRAASVRAAKVLNPLSRTRHNLIRSILGWRPGGRQPGVPTCWARIAGGTQDVVEQTSLGERSRFAGRVRTAARARGLRGAGRRGRGRGRRVRPRGGDLRGGRGGGGGTAPRTPGRRGPRGD